MGATQAEHISKCKKKIEIHTHVKPGFWDKDSPAGVPESLSQNAWFYMCVRLTLVCHVTQRSPQLYLKTKLYLLSCIGGLSKAVVKVQQARNEFPFSDKKVGLESSEELCSPLLAKGKKEKKREQESSFVNRSLRQTRT